MKWVTCWYFPGNSRKYFPVLCISSSSPNIPAQQTTTRLLRNSPLLCWFISLAHIQWKYYTRLCRQDQTQPKISLVLSLGDPLHSVKVLRYGMFLVSWIMVRSVSDNCSPTASQILSSEQWIHLLLLPKPAHKCSTNSFCFILCLVLNMVPEIINKLIYFTLKSIFTESSQIKHSIFCTLSKIKLIFYQNGADSSLITWTYWKNT